MLQDAFFDHSINMIYPLIWTPCFQYSMITARSGIHQMKNLHGSQVLLS